MVCENAYFGHLPLLGLPFMALCRAALQEEALITVLCPLCFLVCKSLCVCLPATGAHSVPASFPTDGFTSEGEYLEISEINREQAGEYECVTANGVSTPDSKHVLITVNCEATFHFLSFFACSPVFICICI